MVTETGAENFSAFASMEELLDKLKLLNYESEFAKQIKLKPLHRYYFVVVKNPGEQFYYFTLIASFLINKMGVAFQQPQEFDDPNETIEKILNVARENGISINFSANKLKQGVGEQVVYLLNNLADAAITKTNFIWQKARAPAETQEEVEAIEDDSEINLDRVEEEMLAAYSDDSDEENLFQLDNIRIKRSANNNNDILSMNHRQQLEINANNNNNIDEETWKLELERVMPQLKVTIKNENRDWRTHFTQMKQYKDSIDMAMGTTKTQLDKLHKEISVTLEKISSREKSLNRELEHSLDEYRILQDQLSKLRDAYKGLGEGVAERNRELARLTDRLESVKQQMEERGSSMTDGTPLVNIKKYVAKIKTEITDMDIRIGILECILLQIKIKEEKSLEREFGQTISVF